MRIIVAGTAIGLLWAFTWFAVSHIRGALYEGAELEPEEGPYDIGLMGADSCYVWALAKPCVPIPAAMAPGMHALVECESRHDPAARGRLGEVGLLQLHPINRQRAERMGYSWAQVRDDPAVNIAVGISIFEDRGWSAWACKEGP